MVLPKIVLVQRFTKLSFFVFFSLSGLFTEAQAQCTKSPYISYFGVSSIYYTGTAISPLNPTNTGDSSSALVVRTLAGNGGQGFINGTGTAALFNTPTGLVVDNTGNIFVADAVNHSIRKITATGVVTTIAGKGVPGFVNGTDTAVRFNSPTGVAVDASGNIYVADANNHCIRKITASGVVSTFAGNGSAGFKDGTDTSASFYYPQGVSVDASGNVYVADHSNNCIRKITATGVVTTLAGSSSPGFADGTGTAARFNKPCGVAVDASGNVYVADVVNHSIRKITSAGLVTTLAGNGSFNLTDGIGSSARFYYPYGVAVDASGNVFVADQSNHSIRKVTAAGLVTTLAGDGNWGWVNGTGTAAKFGLPTGVALDGSGNLYVADKYNNNIRKIALFAYSIKPVLPAGMFMDSMTGQIAGTPMVNTPSTTYTITTQNDCGSNSTQITFATISNPSRINAVSNLSESIKIYPNPASNRVRIDAPVAVSVSVFGMDGRQVLLGKEALDLHLGMLPDGIYWIVICDLQGQFLKADKITKLGK